MRVLLLLVAGYAIAPAQESRPAGLLQPGSPLATVQEALMRGDVAEARTAVDALLATAPREAIEALGPQAALLRAAAEPLARRAAAMLGVATAYADRTVCEAAAVAGLAALLSDGPEVGDLGEPLLSAGAGDSDDRAGAKPSGPTAAERERLLAGFLDVLERRVTAPGHDRAAIGHARRLLAQFPSDSNDWTWVRPAPAARFPARLDAALRLRFFEIPWTGDLPDPSRRMLAAAAPAVDVTLPADRDGIELPALPPGAWLVVATAPDHGYRRSWPIVVSDLELIAHSVPGTVKGLALLAGRPELGATLVRFLDARLASRTRGTQQRDPLNSVAARSGPHLAIAPIATQPTPPEPAPRIAADLWAAQPVYLAGQRVAMRLAVRSVARETPADLPLRIVFWPRQANEMVIETRAAGTVPIELDIPAGAPPGPVRAQVFDATWKPSGATAPDPVVDLIAFTVEDRAAEPVQLLLAAPAAWRPGEADPIIEILGIPGIDSSVSISAGSFRQTVSLVLDAAGKGAVTLEMAKIGAHALAAVPHVDVEVRALAASRDVARANRRIAVSSDAPDAPRAPALAIAVITRSPVAGQDLALALTGPAGEAISLTIATATEIVQQTVALDASGRGATAVPTAAAWATIEIVATSRVLAGGRLERRVQVPLSRPGAPTIAIETDRSEYAAGTTARVALRVGVRDLGDRATVSLAAVDDRLLKFADCGMPDPESALRPRAAPLAVRTAASAPPRNAASWYAAVLGRADRLPPLAPQDPRLQLQSGTRGGTRGPLGRAARPVGEELLRASAPFFVPSIPIDARGDAVVDVPIAGSGPLRIVVTVVDAEGRSGVATKTVLRTAGAGAETRRDRYLLTRKTRAHAALRAAAPKDGSPRYVATLRPEQLAGGHEMPPATLYCWPLPEGFAGAFEEHLRNRPFECADHVSAALALRARTWSGLPAPASMRAAPRKLETVPGTIQQDLVRLRALKTPDGFAWQRGAPTDFEVTPLVLHALAIAADAGIDPLAFGVVPEMRDGFLRAAPRAFADAQGNPEAAVEAAEIRGHAAFCKNVPPERRARVLVDTVIGMLAVDPSLSLAKTSVAGLVRQTRELPAALMARAGLALFRAGDRESAGLALARIESAQDDDVLRLALHLELARLLDAPAARQKEIADRLARLLSEPTWPPAFPGAVAAGTLAAWHRGPGEGPSSRPGAQGTSESYDTTKLDIEVQSDVPEIVTAIRDAHFPDGVPASAAGAPVVTLFDGDRGIPPGTIAVPAGSQLKFTIAATSPARPCAIRWPIPDGVRMLAAPEASIGADTVTWLFREPAAGTELRVEGLVEVGHGLTLWNSCELVSLDTLDVIGWSASLRFEIAEGSPIARPGPPAATMLDAPAIARARDDLLRSIEDASDAATMLKRVKDVISLPDPAVPDALAAAIPHVGPLFDTPESLASLLLALGTRRAAILDPVTLAALIDPRGRARALADAACAYPEFQDFARKWAEAREAPTASENRLAGLIAAAYLRQPDLPESSPLWTPEVLLRLIEGADLVSEDDRAERIAALREIPFQRLLSGLFSGTRVVPDATCAGWVRVLDRVEDMLAAPAVTADVLGLAGAITDRSGPARDVYVACEVALRTRQSEVAAIAVDRGLEMIESHALAMEAAAQPPFTGIADADRAARMLRALGAAVSAGRREIAIPIGIQLLERRRDSFSIADRAGALLATLAAGGPEPWRLPAIAALREPDRSSLPITVIELLLRDAESRSAAIDLLLERDDSADLLRAVLGERLLRHEARRILEKLGAIDPRPFESLPLPRLLEILTQLDADTGKPIEEELRRRAEERPADLVLVLAASRDEKSREALVKALARVRVTEVPWEIADPGAERLQVKLLALAGDEAAAGRIREWMSAAVQAAQAPGASDASLQELWPCLVPHATPLDVLTFGAPNPVDGMLSRSSRWTDEELSAFFRSPEAMPDPGASAGRWGTVAVVVRLVGPARAGALAADVVKLWRAYVDAGLAFDALSIFGQMGGGQPAVLREVMEDAAAASRPARFTDEQRLAYIAALRRDLDIQREVEPLLGASASPEIAKALARYTLDVTGYWKPPAVASTRPTPPTGQEPQLDWQRMLITRLRNEGLAAISRAEPALLRAWEKALRERGLWGW